MRRRAFFRKYGLLGVVAIIASGQAGGGGGGSITPFPDPLPGSPVVEGVALPPEEPDEGTIVWDNTLTVTGSGSSHDLATKLAQAAAMAGNTRIVVPDGVVLDIGPDFFIPKKSGAGQGGWVAIMSQSYANGTFPRAKGQRVDPATDLPAMATIQLTSVDGLKFFSPTATGHSDVNRYCLYGLEIATPEWGAGIIHYGILNFGEGDAARQTNPNDVPHHLVVRHCYLHGHPTTDCKRGVNLNSGWAVIADNYFEDIGVLGNGDAGDIGGWNGTGPYTVDNNYMGSLGINFLYGGATVGINYMARGFVFTRNHVEKPLRYNFYLTSGTYQGIRKSSKNLFETKHGVQWRIEQNIFRNSWTDGQTGGGILLKASNQAPEEGSPSIRFETGHILFRWNKVLNAREPLQTSFRELYGTGDPGGYDVVPLHHVSIVDNLFEGADLAETGDPEWGGRQVYLGCAHPQQRVAVYDFGPFHLKRNTFTKRTYGQAHSNGIIATMGNGDGTWSWRLTTNGQPGGSVWEDNLFDFQPYYGITNQNTVDGIGLKDMGIDARNNVFGRADTTSWLSQGGFDAAYPGKGNVVTDRANILLADRAAGNYRITGGVTATASSVGGPVGVNHDTLDARTAGCVTGIWS